VIEVKFYFLFFVLTVFIVACTQIPEVNDSENTQNNGRLASPTWCQVDEDCVCGGIDINTGDCFVGNRAYYETNVDTSRDCPDFCTGIAGHLVTKCVNNVCQNVPRDDFNTNSTPNEPVFCTADAKLCPDGTAVGRVGPNCEFAPCPESTPPSAPDDLSAAHWQCEDGSWKNNPEDCFENNCVTKDDCQLMGVKGVCGPYMIAGPTRTLHKPPIFYSNQCNGEYCPEVMALCVDPKDQPRITGVACDVGKCVVRYEQVSGIY
jgi:hypothetical protein